MISCNVSVVLLHIFAPPRIYNDIVTNVDENIKKVKKINMRVHCLVSIFTF